MAQNKTILLFLLIFSLFSCEKNEKSKTKIVSKPSILEVTQNTESKTPLPDSVFKTPEDSIRATKESVLRKKNYKKKKQTLAFENTKSENTKPSTFAKEQTTHSFLYIEKILRQCKIGVPMTQEDLSKKFNIPEEGIKLVKTVTKISENELYIQWKSTWLIEKMSDAKFKDGRLKVHFDKNKMYTSGGAIAIKYEKKTYTDLVLIGRSAYIPTVKGYYWEIGKK